MSSSSDDDVKPVINEIPPHIIKQAAASTTDNQLPEKSRIRYEIVYQKFMDWQAENNVASFSENELMDYFAHLTKLFKPSSLWAIYSMLRSMLSLKNNINIANYPKLRAHLKRQSTGYSSKKSNTLTAEQIKKYINEAPDSNHLFIKAVMIIGISGACRKQELKDLKITDVEDTGKILHIQIPETKTQISRSFVVSGSFYKKCKQYMELRQQITDLNITRFFLNYQNEKCTKQVVGINKIGNVPKKIAEYLKLRDPSAYTGHCLRRTSTTVLIDASGDLRAVKRHGRWRTSTAQTCVDNSSRTKTLTANETPQSVENNTNDSVENPINHEIIQFNVLNDYEEPKFHACNRILDSAGAPISPSIVDLVDDCSNQNFFIKTEISDEIPENGPRKRKLSPSIDLQIQHNDESYDDPDAISLQDLEANRKICGICDKHITSGEFQNCGNYAHVQCAVRSRNLNWKCNEELDKALKESELKRETLINENSLLKQLNEQKSLVNSMLMEKVAHLEKQLLLKKS